tara:strand:+ start:342 stop:800 length:459 start_codon:yes stop_codon:yes gene_type:complete
MLPELNEGNVYVASPFKISLAFLDNYGLSEFKAEAEKMPYIQQEILLNEIKNWISLKEKLPMLMKLIFTVWKYKVPDKEYSPYFSLLAQAAFKLCELKLTEKECLHKLLWIHKMTMSLKRRDLESGWSVEFQNGRYYYTNSHEKRVIRFFKI